MKHSLFLLAFYILVYHTNSFSEEIDPSIFFKNPSSLIKTNKDIKNIFLKDIDSVSIEIKYTYHGDYPTEPSLRNHGIYKTNLIINIPKEDNAIWRNLFYRSLDSICIEDTSKVSFLLDGELKLLFTINLFYKTQSATILIPSGDLKGNELRFKSKGILYFLHFNKKAIESLNGYLQDIIKRTIPKEILSDIIYQFK